jgi:hypothetical protein
MAEVTDPKILQQLNVRSAAPLPSAPRPAMPQQQAMPAPQAPRQPPKPEGLSDNVILRGKQLQNLLDQGSLAKNALELQRLGLEIKRIQGDLNKSGLTERQSMELARYISEREGQNYYKLAETMGFTPNSLLNKFSTGVEKFTGSQDLGDWARSLDKNNAAQIAKTGQNLFLEGIKREMTGAAGNMKEPEEILSQYFPGPFQRTDPELWRSLERTRQAQIDAAYRNSGLATIPGAAQTQVPLPKSSFVPKPTKALPKEEDIQHTMKVNKMSREAVLKALGY